jgi:DNA-binding transcriptional ArsR family regulator
MEDEQEDRRDAEHPDEQGPSGQGDGARRRSVSRISDPRALRALAHPIRLSLLSQLRSRGPLTATKAGELIGESSASCSFHLRQLSKYGLVEEAGGGHGRERPWRATAMTTDVPEIAENPEFESAAQLFRSIVLDRYYAGARRWLDQRADEPAQWQRASQFNDYLLYLTADELADLTEQIQALNRRYADRLTNPELRPPESRLVSSIQLGFPIIDGPEDQ